LVLSASEQTKALDRLFSAAMETDQHWTEVLRCQHCGIVGIAELSAGDSAFKDHADLIPVGFKVVPLKYGIGFYCVDCDMPVRP
jgi:hypothetical protein